MQINKKYFDDSFANDYLFTKQFNSIENIREDCLRIAPSIKKKFNKELGEAIAGGYHADAPETTKLFNEYEDTIQNIDFRLDTERLKKDIQKRTTRFLKVNK